MRGVAQEEGQCTYYILRGERSFSVASFFIYPHTDCSDEEMHRSGRLSNCFGAVSFFFSARVMRCNWEERVEEENF